MKAERIAGIAAIVFGALTLVSGGKALFGGADMGAVVPFVLWFNFLAGFFYVLAGALILIGHRTALPMASALLAATALVFAGFLWWLLRGGAYEMRTLGAMLLRTAFWAVMVWVVARGRRL